MPDIDKITLEVQTKTVDTAKSIENLAKKMESLQNSVSSLAPKLNSVGTSLQGVSGASKKATTGMGGGGSNLLANLYMFKSIGMAVGKTMKLATDYIETMNLFGVVMGSNAKKANDFQIQMEGLGVDREQSMRFQSSFYDIGRSLGMTEKNAYTLSEQFTKLGYDYASLYNMPVEQSFEKLQSGIVGVVRPLRNLGKDIQETKLKETALSLGIHDNVRMMNQSDKATLRFITLMRQSGKAMNDMERTLYTPANALRILKAQFTSLARELGNLFIPILASVLPWLIAISKFLRGIISDIAAFFGVKLFALDFSGLDGSMGMADEYTEEVADNLDSGAKSAKQIKDYMIGIDELNVLNTDTGNIDRDTGGGGKGTGGGGGGNKLDDLNLEDFGYEDLFKKINDQAGGILDTLNKWKPVIIGIAGVLGTMWMLTKVANFLLWLGKIGGMFGTLWGALSSLGLGFVVLGDAVLSSMGIVTGSFAVAGAAGVATVAAVVAAAALIGWGIYEGCQPGIDTINVLGDGISKVSKEKLGPFITSWEDTGKRLSKIKLMAGAITNEDVDYLGNKAKEMSDAVLNELSADRNQELADISMLGNLQGTTEAEIQALTDSTNNFYDKVTTETETAQTEINNILAKYRGQNIAMTEEDNTKLEGLYKIIGDNAVSAMSESAKEQELILQRLEYNKKALTVQAGSEAIKEAKDNYDTQIKEADDWNVRSLASLDKRFRVEKTITEDEYNTQKGIISKSYDEMTNTAESKFEDINGKVRDGLGDQAKYVKEGTGEIKSNFDLLFEDPGGTIESWGAGMASAWNSIWNIDWAGVVDTWLIQPLITAWNALFSFDWLGPLLGGLWGALIAIDAWILNATYDYIVKPLFDAWWAIIGFEWLGPLLDGIGGCFIAMYNWVVVDFDKNIMQPIKDAWNALLTFDYLGALWGGIVACVTWIKDNAGPKIDECIIQPLKNLWGGFLTFEWVVPLWNGIVNSVSAIVGWLADKAIQWIWNPLVDCWNAFLTFKWVGPLWDGIVASVAGIVGWLADKAIEWIWDPIVDCWNAFLTFDWLGPLWDGIKSGISGITESVKNAFKDYVITPIKNAWNDFWDGIGKWWDNSSLNPSNWFGGGSGETEGTVSVGVNFSPNNSITPTVNPGVMAFAQGGFVPRRANFISPDAWTAGEAGKELTGSYKGHTTVMPLENTSFVSAIHDAVYDAVMGASKNSETTIVVQPKVKLDSRDIAQGQEEYKFKSGSGLVRKR